MIRRVLGPVGGPVAFFLVAALVFAGLGWVTVASLRVERAQREAAARAEHEANLRIALWRLDARMLPILGVEDSRPFHHYAGSDIQTIYGPGTAPLLEPDLPPWMRLHFQIDPHEGWSSPQVMPLVEMDRLKGSWPGLSLRNVTPDRAALLAQLSAKHPPLQVTATFAQRERQYPSDGGPLVNWQYATPVGQPLEQLQPVQPSPALPPAAAPGAAAPAEPASKALSQNANPEYTAPLARFESGAKQAGAAKDYYSQAPQTNNSIVPGNSTNAVNPNPRGPEANVLNESQNRAGILQRGFNDARSASNYPYSQNMQINPMGGTLVGPNSLGGVGGGGAGFGGGYGANPGIRKAPNNAGGIAQANPVVVPVAPTAPQAPLPPGGPIAPSAGPNDKASLAAGARPGAPMAGGSGGGGAGPGGPSRGSAEKDGSGDANRDKKAENGLANAGPSAAMAKPGTGGAPFSAAKLNDDARRGNPKFSEQPPPSNGPFRSFGEALRARTQEPMPKGDDRFASGPVVPPAPSPVPAPETEMLVLPAQPIIHIGSIHPQWLAAADGTDVLVLVRTAHIDNRIVFQGVVLDWDQLEVVLRESVRDLFPEARLVPVRDPAAVVPERAMTALPVQLEPGTMPVPAAAGWSPLRFGLVLAWVATLVAVIAVGLSGWSLIDLAERRIRFVSAVTHELRTPLTSLRLYLDLLLSGLVQEEDKRREYLATLNVESDRLHRLIDNVLDFARLEGRRKASDAQSLQVAALLDQIRETWTERCAASEKELVVIGTLPADEQLNTDPALVLQIVGNLIENARKYSRDAADRRIWVWAKPGTGRRRFVIEVEDRGPGVPPRERSLIFRPFRRGSEADATAGGAGLGLALAKQWAELLGGRLSYRPADGGTGACFRLELRGG